MNAFIERLRVRRLAFTFTILVTLTAGILIGSVVSHGVKGKEQSADSSGATQLRMPDAKVLSNTFSNIAKEVGPAVVNINTESLPKENTRRRNPHARNMPQNPNNDDGDDDDQGQGQGSPDFQDFFNRFFGGQAPEGGMPGEGAGIRESLGSGFIVDPKGYIITNNHVIDKADKIFVKLSTDPHNPQDHGRPAHVIGVDKATDIAVIKIDVNYPLPTVKLGNSDSAQVGDWVIAIGSPFDLSNTVTAGIVSAKGREIEGGRQGQFQRFIQTDAAINPGNSGGPLVDMNGDVIGVNTAIYTQSNGYQGIGFAMPSRTVIQTYNDLIGPAHKVVRGSIGITFEGSLPSAVSRVYGFKSGVLISGVTPGTPAARAGLKSGDIITSVDGREIKDGDELVGDISARKPGSKVQIGYMRDGKPQSSTVEIADRDQIVNAATEDASNDNSNSPNGPDAAQGKIGITFKAIPSEMASKLGTKGVVVQSVKPGSFADEIGLAQGVIITSVNRKPVSNEQDFRSAINALKSGDDVVFTITSPNAADKGSVNYVGGTLP